MKEDKDKSEKIEALLHRRARILSDDESIDTSPVETLQEPLEIYQKEAPKSKFEILELLGSGNMGEVYKAYEPMLQRHVALKFLKGDDPAELSQFLREARAQAKIDHEHICSVYEVGELQGKYYIAMQYIQGKTLQEAAHEMVLEQKIMALKQAAEAVHAAHEIGLIHRDIKPSNILVEKINEQWKPYVMDFGLVREQAAPGITRTGFVVGSPSYMPPEQALGDLSKLDRRSDVYALGAALYELLCGRPPFEGSNVAEVIVKALQEEPKSLRKINPSIPGDLEAISMKCLEKEPHRRYDSAKALAEDLHRYLQAEPVMAQRTSWYYWAFKKAKKNKTTTAIGAIALVVVFLLAGLWLRAGWQASEQARLAQQFGQEVEKIEGFMRYAYSLPLHDVRRERAIVEDRMKWIENEMKRIGNSGLGPGNYALGSGYNALHKYEKAQEYLAQAWNHGYQTPEVARALGQVLGVLYQKGLQEVERIGNKTTREARIKQLESKYRDPALLYLKEGSGLNLESTLYVEALIAFYEKRYEDSLKKVRQSALQVPWLYEVHLLEGNAHMQIGSKQRKFGEYKKALENLTAAAKKFEQASEIARSDATIYESQCRLWNILERVQMDTGQSSQNAFEQVLATCGNALIANPDSAEAYETQANSMWLMGWYNLYTGKDPSELFLKSIEMSQRASTLNPRMVLAFVDTTTAYRYFGDYIEQIGKDPTSYYQKGIQSCEKGLRVDENDFFSHQNMGGIYSSLGKYSWRHGSNPKEFFYKSIRSYQMALRTNPGSSETHNNLGTIYSSLGDYVINYGENPTEFYQNAIKSLEKSIALNPNIPYSYANLGAQHQNLATYAMQEGKDPMPSLNKSLEIFQKGINANPNFYYTYFCQGLTYFQMAEYDLLQSKDPAEFEKSAIASLEKALGLNPQDLDANLYLSSVYAQSAKYLIHKKLSPLKALNRSNTYIENGIRLNPSSGDPYLRKGELETLRARWEIQTGKSPFRSLRISRESLQRAIDINREDPRAYLAMAKNSLTNTEWAQIHKQVAKDEIGQGLEMTRKVLSLNSNSSEALALQGSLYLFQALSEKEIKLRQEAAQTARDLLEKSLQNNPLLKMEYQSYLDRGRALL